MYDHQAIMKEAHARRRKAAMIANSMKHKNLVTKEWVNPSLPAFSEFLREAWRAARKETGEV